jgi:hypothetical protein
MFRSKNKLFGPVQILSFFEFFSAISRELSIGPKALVPVLKVPVLKVKLVPVLKVLTCKNLVPVLKVKN